MAATTTSPCAPPARWSKASPNVFGKSRHPITAPKRQLSAAWDLPRKSKNLRPCAVHFGVLHKVFFLLILSLQITQLPLLSSPSGHEQTQKRYPFFSGQTPILPHYIIVPTPRNRREIPVFFSSRFQREKDRVKKRLCNFLEWLQTFLHIFLWNRCKYPLGQSISEKFRGFPQRSQCKAASEVGQQSHSCWEGYPPDGSGF